MTATRITNVNFTKYIIKKYDQISKPTFLPEGRRTRASDAQFE